MGSPSLKTNRGNTETCPRTLQKLLLKASLVEAHFMDGTVCQRVMQHSPVIQYCHFFFSVPSLKASQAAIWEHLIVLLNTFTNLIFPLCVIVGDFLRNHTDIISHLGTAPNSRDIFRNYIITFIYMKET